MLVLSMNLAKCDVNFVKFEYTMDSYGIYVFAVNASVMVSQGLLTGYTREALCKSLSTGTFVYNQGREGFKCGKVKSSTKSF